MARLTILVLAALVLVAVAGCGGGGDEAADRSPTTEAAAPEPSAPAFDESSIEFQLAVIDEVASAPGDPAVRGYAKALDRLQVTCTDTRRQLGDYAVNTSHLIQDQTGQPEGVIVVLEQVRESIPKGYPRRSCDDLFVAYATLRTEGFS